MAPRSDSGWAPRSAPRWASRWAPRWRRWAPAAAGVLAAAAVAGCGGAHPRAATGPTPAPPAGTVSGTAGAATTPVLPAGELRALVVDPAEAPAGLALVANGSGPQTAAEIAAGSARPTRTLASLRSAGFTAGYAVTYADPVAGRVLAHAVLGFASPSGAAAFLRGELAATPPPGAAAVALPTVGDQSGAVRQRYPGGGPRAQLVTLRFRVGRYVEILSVGSAGTVDPAAVRGIAASLATVAARA